jgi:hypothetical protein
MPQSKILIDTNTYLRLAQSVHPLLGQSFGEMEFCLYIIPELEHELKRSPRLAKKIAWVSESRYLENRKKRLVISKKQLLEIGETIDFILDASLDAGGGVSPIDCRALACGNIFANTGSD